MKAYEIATYTDNAIEASRAYKELSGIINYEALRGNYEIVISISQSMEAYLIRQGFKVIRITNNINKPNKVNIRWTT